MRKRGMSIREIAKILGCDKDTVTRMLKTDTDHKYEREHKPSQVDAYKEHIQRWLRDGVPVQRMLELAQEDPEQPYTASRSAFYTRVAEMKKAWDLEEKARFMRFEGMPSEYVQIDWGEVRDFKFDREPAATMYFFAARLKWSRFSYVEFVANTRLETLIRCMLRAFASFGGVPWIAVFDNMKTVVSRRDERQRPVWNPQMLKFSAEFDFHMEACWPASGNQKGVVENLVGWVKSNFLTGRTFLDRAHLAHECQAWLTRINSSVSQAHGEVPVDVLPREQARFTKLIEGAEDYGIAVPVQAGSDMLVHVDGNRYMVPSRYVGRPLLARVRQRRIDFYDATTQVATYERRMHKEFRPIQNPNYCEDVLKNKPRARVMLYRSHLMEQDPSIAAFISTLCRRHRGDAAFGPHILTMYQLWKQHGTDNLGVACAIASEHGSYSAEYLVSLLRDPRPSSVATSLELPGVPEQVSIDRDLQVYEDIVQGRAH